MAFVYRTISTRIPIKEQNSLPQIDEQYDQLKDLQENHNNNSSIYNKSSNNNSSLLSNNSKKLPQPPFGTTSKKQLIFSPQQDPEIPGPGSYNVKNPLIKKKFNVNETTPDHDKNSKKLFISKEKRFNNDVSEVPGPGKYNPYSSKNIKSKNNKKYSSLYKTENNYKPFSTERVLSIPSKCLNFGYEIGNDGSTYLLTDPKEKNFKNKSCDAEKKENNYNKSWCKNGTGVIDWNKSMNTNCSIKKKENGNKFNSSQFESNHFNSNASTECTNNMSLNILNCNKNNYDRNYFYTQTDANQNKTNFQVKFSNSKIYKNSTFTKDLFERNKNFFNFLKTHQNFENYNNNHHLAPGPGTYNLVTENYFKPKDEKFQFFGSSSCRGILYNIKNNHLNLGKSNSECVMETYTKNNNNNNNSNNISEINSTFLNKNISENISKTINITKKENKKKTSQLQKIIETQKQKVQKEKKEQATLIGPGSYDPINPQKKLNNIENFGSLERRFPINIPGSETPGVGAYLPLETWGPKNKNNNLKSLVPQAIFKKHKEYDILKNENMKNVIMGERRKIPCLGQYYPEKKNSIEYNVIKSSSVGKNQPGFGSSFKRFYIFKNKINEMNGVGSYNIDYKNVEMMQQTVPFLRGADKNDFEKYKKRKEMESKKGPGEYRKDSYFDWNKKSFNILFN